jgi:hypothetical protein
VYVISLQSAPALLPARRALQPRRVAVWPAVNATAERRAAEAARGTIPRDYAADAGSAVYELAARGITGIAAAHLTLLHHTAREEVDGDCTHTAVFEDDIALLPGFASWSAELADGAPDFLNMCVVRGFGQREQGRAALRVTPQLRWPARNPNVLMVAYLVARATLPTLLAAFDGVVGWRRHCTVDQVMPRVQYALSAAGYRTLVVDAFDDAERTRARVAHCGDKHYCRPSAGGKAAAAAENGRRLLEKGARTPKGGGKRAECAGTRREAHEACAALHPRYGQPSRSRPHLSPGSVRAAGTSCAYGFRVPGDLVSAAAAAANRWPPSAFAAATKGAPQGAKTAGRRMSEPADAARGCNSRSVRHGAFCATRKADPNLCTSVGLARALAHQFANSSVFDIGCGRGGYGRHFAEHAPGVRWRGVDGAEGIEEATSGFVRFADLAERALPAAASTPSDWVMSLEVAEHLSRGDEPTFMHHVVSRAARGVLLSWSPPRGPAGHQHVNCQSSAYVKCAMALVGLRYAPDLTLRLASAVRSGPPPRCPWLAYTLHAFTPDATTSSPLLPLPPEPSAEWAARYLRATRERCAYSHDGCDWRSDYASRTPAGLATGYCAVTRGGPSDCAAGSMGSWRLSAEARKRWRLDAALAECVARCRGCERCRYISVSARHGDCSWTHECDLDGLKRDVAGFKSLRVQ